MRNSFKIANVKFLSILITFVFQDAPKSTERVKQYKWLPLDELQAKKLPNSRYKCGDYTHRGKFVALCKDDWDEVSISV